MSGWIKLHRKLKESAIWSDSLRLKAWIDILLTANHEDNEFFRNGNLVKVKKGQFITSNRKLQDAWGCSTNTVTKILKQLEELGMISYSTEAKRYTVITVINYGVYQDRVYSDRDTERDTQRDSERDIERDTERDDERVQTRNNKNNKKEKNNKEIEASPQPFKSKYNEDGWTDWMGG